MKNLLLITVFTLFLTACGAPPASPSPTVLPSPTATSTPALTATPEPTATPTETPVHLYTLSGVIFFDYNGSGEQDAAYNMNGEENQEPGIAGVPICVDANPSPLSVEQIEARVDCAITGEDGSYSIEGIELGRHEVYIVSPSDEPAEAFRYINISHGWVDIPAYEMNDVQVPAQHLPDTEIQSIRTPIDLAITEDQILDVALMQGFLTLPFVQEQIPEPFIWNYFDILNNLLFDDAGENNFWSSHDGVMLNYDGLYNSQVPVSQFGALRNLNELTGVGDSHG